MAETQMMEMSVESLARMNVQSRLRERARVMTEVTAAGDVYRAAGKTEIADAFDRFAESLTAGMGEKAAVKIDTGTPYGSNVVDVEPVSPELLDPMGDGSGLPVVHLNDDETDARNHLRNVQISRAGGGAGFAAGSLGAMMRD